MTKTEIKTTNMIVLSGWPCLVLWGWQIVPLTQFISEEGE